MELESFIGRFNVARQQDPLEGNVNVSSHGKLITPGIFLNVCLHITPSIFSAGLKNKF